ncbi:MAG: glycosyltransferase [Chitinispirillaceae bacterium]|nr:glycosyltransferase [Chitinispirillaceae bacterium]
MNVLMVGYTFYDEDGRVRKYAEALTQKGYKVDFVGIKINKNTSLSYELKGVNVYNIQNREINEKRKLDYVIRIFSFFLKTFFFVTINFFRKRYKIIHVHNMPDFEVFVTIIPKLFGSKIILDIHDLFPEFYSVKFSGGKNSLFYSMLFMIERLSCQFADHVIISNHLWYDKITNRSVKKENCTTIINYPDSNIFYKRFSRIKSNNKYVLFYHGTISAHQGLDIAVSAVSRLVIDFNYDFVEFHIYGIGPERENILRQIETLNLGKQVKIFDTLPLEEIVLKINEEADIGIVPKRNDGFGGEAFSTKILEFMLMEVPVIVAATKIDTYYFNENIVNFFEPEDINHLAQKIKFCIDNPLIIEEKVKKAKKFVENITWDKKKDEYLKIISKLIGDSF